MIMNNGPLETIDNKILYQIALDSIPSSRKEVMEAATANNLGITLPGLAEAMRIPEESAKIHLDDLVALNIIDRHKGTYDKKFVYKMRDTYRQLMSKFENIAMEEKALDKEEEFVPPPEDPIGVPIDQIPPGLFNN
jgi:predicted transcriptional regulator